MTKALLLLFALAACTLSSGMLSDYRNVSDVTVAEEDFDEEPPSNRTGRFFPLFTIIRFLNTECTGAGSFTGTCFTRRECSDLGGLKTATCASKRGVCCVVQKQCSSTSNVNNTYFTNPGYPASFNGGTVCTIRVTRCNSDICQLRIDLQDLTLAQPNANGVCQSDFLTVTGGSSQAPARICGENSGQHMYVNFNGNNPITITVTTSAAVSVNRRWSMKLTQLACTCPTLAPLGCLQYYTGTTGTVRSFNYGTQPNPLMIVDGVVGTREIANLNYGACVRPEAGYCSITWAQTSDVFSFTTSSDVRGMGDVVGTPAGSVSGAACTTDFVVIPNPSVPAGVNAERFCGIGFPAAVTTFSRPFVLTVVTNGDDLNPVPEDSNRGFILTYTQNECLPA